MVFRHGEGHDAGFRILDGVVHEIADYFENEEGVRAYDDILGGRNVLHLHMVDCCLHF